MKRVIAVVMLFFILFANCAWAPSEQTKKASAQKEAYFKDHKNDVLFVIAAVDPNSGIENFEQGIEIVLTIITEGKSDTFKTRTPYVLLVPMDKVMDIIFKNQPKKFNIGKDVVLAELSLIAPRITIMAQSQASYAGVGGHVYFAGKEVLRDNSAIEYGTVNLSYTLPVREIYEAEN